MEDPPLHFLCKGFSLGEVMMKKIYSLNYLSTDFYDKYDSKNYPEIEHKASRPYLVMLIKIGTNTYAIPFRTNIRHRYCYKFKTSDRNTQSITGLDYTKAVIINDMKYIGNKATIDNKEFVELNNKYFFIVKQFKKYVDGYRRYINGELNTFEQRKYQFSTLKYFHKEMNI